MSKQKREKLTTTATPEKNRPGKTFFQIEEELTKAQLETIASTTVNSQQSTVNSQQSTINHQPLTINKS